MEITNNNSAKMKLLSAVSLGHFMNDFYMGMIPPITFLFAKVLSLSLIEQGAITVVSVIFGSLAQPLFGYFVDKKASPNYLLYSIIWISLFMSLSVVVNNYYIVLLLISLGSLSSSLYHPLGSTVASNIMEKSKGMSLSIFMTVGGFAISLVPIIALSMSENFGFKSLAFLCIPGFIAAFLMKLLGINNKVSISKKIENKETDEVIYDINKKVIGINLITISFVKVFLRSALITYGAQLMLMNGYDLEFAGWILSAHLFLRPFGTISGGVLSDKIGEKSVMLISVLGGGISLFAFAFLGGKLSILGFLIWGFFFAMSNSANVTMMQEVFPKGQSMSTGLILGLPNGIGAAFVLLFGKFADYTDLLVATKYSLLLIIVAIVLIFTLPSKFNVKTN